MPTLVTRGAASVRGFGFAGTTPVLPDPYFNYTTLLLHGNGTNGGQNNTFQDSSTNNFTITRNGNTTQGTFSPFSQTGWSNYFDGSGDYLSAPSNAAFDIKSGNFTIEFWLYPQASNYTFLIRRQQTTGSYLGWSVRKDTSNLITFDTGTPGSLFSNNPVTLNTWTHVAVVKSSTTVTIYLNGISNGSFTIPSTTEDTSSLFVGGTDHAAAECLNGYMSNVRIVKGTAVYTSNFTPPTAPLTNITNTSLLTCQSNRFVDNGTANSGSGFTLTVNGNTSVQAFSPFAPTAAYSASTVGGSGYFDGTGDYLGLSTQSAFPTSTQEFTVEFWAYKLNAWSTNNQYIFDSSASGGFQIWVNTGDGVLRLGRSAVAVVLDYNYSSLQINTWTHFAYSRKGNDFALWVNGTRVATTTNTNGFATANDTQVIGAPYTGSSSFWNGYLSSIRVVRGSYVYDTASSTITVPTAPLTAISGTSLLTNFTNAAIIDNTAKNVLETVVDAQISTTQSKFGGASLYFDGSGDYLIMPDAQTGQFLTGDFTVEYWCRFGSQGTNYAPQVGTLTSASPSGTWRFGTFTNNGGVYLAYHNGSTFVDVQFGSTAYNDNTWRHFALTRSGTTVRAFVDGTQVGTNQTVSQNFNSSNKVSVGAELLNPTYFNGYIDDLRITKGIARYTSNFTPQTSQWQDQ